MKFAPGDMVTPYNRAITYYNHSVCCVCHNSYSLFDAYANIDDLDCSRRAYIGDCYLVISVRKLGRGKLLLVFGAGMGWISAESVRKLDKVTPAFQKKFAQDMLKVQL